MSPADFFFFILTPVSFKSVQWFLSHLGTDRQTNKFSNIYIVGVCGYPTRGFGSVLVFFGSGRVGPWLYPKASKVRRYSFESEISLTLRFRENITQNFSLILANKSLKFIIFFYSYKYLLTLQILTYFTNIGKSVINLQSPLTCPKNPIKELLWTHNYLNGPYRGHA